MPVSQFQFNYIFYKIISLLAFAYNYMFFVFFITLSCGVPHIISGPNAKFSIQINCFFFQSGMRFLFVFLALFSLQSARNLKDPASSTICAVQDGWGCNCSSDSRHIAAKCKVAFLPHIDKYINNSIFVQRL